MNKHFMFFKRIISILLLLTGFFSLQAQTVLIKGTVKNSLNRPLLNANVFAVPKAKDVNITYAISDFDGNYNLKLKKRKTYKVTTSHLGYLKNTVTFNFMKDTVYHFVLKHPLKNSQTLKLVIVKV